MYPLRRRKREMIAAHNFAGNSPVTAAPPSRVSRFCVSVRHVSWTPSGAVACAARRASPRSDERKSQMSWKGYLVLGAVVLVTIAIATRIPAIRRLVFNEAAPAA